MAERKPDHMTQRTEQIQRGQSEDFHAEVRRMLLRSRQLNEQQDALAASFIELHEATHEYEIDELTRCLIDTPTNEDYAACLVRIDNWRYPQELESESDPLHGPAS
ncbi:MAG: hypothetical protein AAGG48_14705 [Planctomycetota bacterium]